MGSAARSGLHPTPGASLPELVTSVVAAIRGQRDLAVGNVAGSHLFNILGVLGLSSIVAAERIGVSPAALRFDIPVMIAAAVACLPILFTGNPTEFLRRQRHNVAISALLKLRP